MQEKDILRRFLFDGLAVRGEWLNLTESWQAAKQHHQYPEPVIQLLGEALVAATLLSATIKFNGNLILQAQGDGPLKSLVAQSSNKKEIRGWARCDNDSTGNNLPDLLGAGRIVLTIEPDQGEPYQGIVPLIGDRLENAVETYFTQSEQLKTRLWLFANEHQAAGLLIQELPAQQDTETQEDWTRIEALANTISKEELLTLPCEEVLHRLFNEEPVRLFTAEPISFKCRCSVEKVETTLLSLGREAVDEILAEQSEIIADCEFCSTKYHFDKVDIARVFSGATAQPNSKTQH
ncbi:molecular chaperone Hsp33 [Bathymodiolus platifrons methanotrophic gill symbiont]|uniref:Hsp33 family molecular chaperone HslO n=1 Tax=Bathymodiolus platifrons methanotrophic gill symbiont TaxID=113268 RepID=UPI000B40D369|nr:Hsp33 family molecular chaperone HslO [Bathymodiolus platifrons methanotrophic gill symbiont]MCK5870437.1 Hsp33 family molecular chaperone HslO [Methyloprofundus sp.]TXK96536.1 redox-regulated molecular chaperone Hsp33 [Methylococcaceae bacterium CS4]TXK98940.1 redox-regulated molecular chaperone Hsp33 [Methylococcaceae bacterium CS5]TXL06839.1 redox-regulated molecular chaperone Hsp33 [Methylococcaceae bacterium CS3]TXL07569.1 redox-regulated molecular chaperone Hsp33 [Methylococcaceae bac